jgi:hypothetical protein
MATKTDFTEDEWETMQKGVSGAGMLVSLADSGFFDTFKEVGAMTKHLKAAHEQSPSTLIRDLAEIKGTGFGVRSSPQEVETETLSALGKAVSTLETKAPDEVEAYRSFVLDVAESVAQAAKDTGAAETGALEKIKTALSGPETPSA